MNKRIPRNFLLIISIVFLITELGCEENERYYRPNLLEKLCCIGIIDIDDTTLRHISFEKSYQIEYADEVNDSLRELNFTISSAVGEIFRYQSDSTMKTLKNYKIPDSVAFNSGERYFIRAKDKDMPEISAEAKVPGLPPAIIYNSMHYEEIDLSEPKECITGWDHNIIRLAVINISFNINTDENNKYFALLISAAGASYTSLPPWFTEFRFLDFFIRGGNTSGFLAEMYGLKMRHWLCKDDRLYTFESPVYAYFIENSKIEGNRSDLEIVIQYSDSYSLFDYLTSVRIKLFSIPENLYEFEKSIYTYNQTSRDPFTEPVYLEGNIKGGNGIFAVCRSSAITIELPFPTVQ